MSARVGSYRSTFLPSRPTFQPDIQGWLSSLRKKKDAFVGEGGHPGRKSDGTHEPMRLREVVTFEIDAGRTGQRLKEELCLKEEQGRGLGEWPPACRAVGVVAVLPGDKTLTGQPGRAASGSSVKGWAS